MTREELDRRLADADLALLALRRATRELRELGASVLASRAQTPQGS